jgi:hypothetical protein
VNRDDDTFSGCTAKSLQVPVRRGLDHEIIEATLVHVRLLVGGPVERIVATTCNDEASTC